MSAFAALKKAALAALLADAGVAALVDKRVFDVPPGDPRSNARDVKTPFVYLGPLTYRYTVVGCGDASTVRMRFYAASLSASRDEAWNVSDAVRIALRGQILDLLPDAAASSLLVVAGGDVVTPGGVLEAWVDFETLLTTA